jgi:hypothetical protein
LKFVRISLSALCLTVSGIATALAQTQPGATKGNAGSPQRLTAELSLSQGINSGMPSELRSLAAGDQPEFGRYATMFTGAIDYTRRTRSSQFGGSASTYVRHIPGGLDASTAVTYRANGTADFRLPNRGSLKISQTAAHSPPYLYQLFPTAAPLPLGDSVPVSAGYLMPSIAYRTTADLAFGSVRDTQVTATVDYSYDDFDDRPNAPHDLVAYGVGVKVSQAFSRQGEVFAGYQRRKGDYDSTAPTNEHRVTLGMAYSAALSATRRLNFRFQVSPSAIENSAGPELGGNRVYPVQGEASVEYPFRLKWRAQASYRRSVEYVPGVSQPLLSSGTRFTLTGSLGRRLELSAVAGSGRGASTISSGDGSGVTSTAEARFSYAVTRTFGLYSEYVYFQYDLRDQSSLAPGLPGRYRLHEGRVGVTLFTPLIGK